MAKQPKKTEEKISGGSEVSQDAATQAAEVVEKAKAASKSRGPRGVVETAVITVLAPTNPKRQGSKAFEAFGTYRTGMTVKEFADALDANPNLKGSATGHLVYDTKHGFISIDGYDPGAIIAPKPPKEKKVKAPKVDKAPDPEAAAEATSEKMDGE